MHARLTPRSFPDQSAKVQVTPKGSVRRRTDNQANHCTFTVDSAFVDATTPPRSHTNETDVLASAKADAHARQAQPLTGLANSQPSSVSNFTSRTSFLSTVLGDSEHVEPPVPQDVPSHTECTLGRTRNDDLLQLPKSPHSPPIFTQSPSRSSPE